MSSAAIPAEKEKAIVADKMALLIVWNEFMILCVNLLCRSGSSCVRNGCSERRELAAQFGDVGGPRFQLTLPVVDEEGGDVADVVVCGGGGILSGSVEDGHPRKVACGIAPGVLVGIERHLIDLGVPGAVYLGELRVYGRGIGMGEEGEHHDDWLPFTDDVGELPVGIVLVGKVNVDHRDLLGLDLAAQPALAVTFLYGIHRCFLKQESAGILWLPPRNTCNRRYPDRRGACRRWSSSIYNS